MQAQKFRPTIGQQSRESLGVGAAKMTKTAIFCEKGPESARRPIWSLFADSARSDLENCSFSQICEKGSARRDPFLSEAHTAL